MSTKVITSENFAEEVLQAKGMVLLDFWAEWCGPCRALGPIIEEVAADHPEVKVGKVNVDEQQVLAQQYSQRDYSGGEESVVEGKSVRPGVYFGGRRIIQKNKCGRWV